MAAVDVVDADTRGHPAQAREIQSNITERPGAVGDPAPGTVLDKILVKNRRRSQTLRSFALFRLSSTSTSV